MRRRLITPIAALTLGTLCVTWAPHASHADPPARGVAARASGWLGFVAEPSKKGDEGVRVKQVLRRSPASRASLRPGDVLTKSGDTRLRTSRDLRAVSRLVGPGEDLPLTVRRGDATLEVTLTLAPRPTQSQLLSTQLMGLTAPDATLTSARDGSTFTLSSLRGTPVVIEFWATWCAGCKPLAPHLDALAKDLGEKGHVLAITDEPAATVAKTNPAKRPVHVALAPSPKTLDAFFVQQMPIVLLIDSDGVVRKAYTGLEHPEVIAKGLREALAGELE